MNTLGAIGIMAKWPAPGRVKTRLQPILQQAGCIALARFLIQRLAIQLNNSQQPWMLFAEGGTPTQWTHLLSECSGSKQPSGFLGVVPQVQGHLGLRIQHALHSLLVQHEVAAVVGADAVMFQAYNVHELLNTANKYPNQAVFIPAHDGGYVALAITRKHLHCGALFSASIPWGSAQVLKASISAVIDDTQASPILLPAQPDIDEPADLVWLNGMQSLKHLQ